MKEITSQVSKPQQLRGGDGRRLEAEIPKHREVLTEQEHSREEPIATAKRFEQGSETDRTP